MVPPETQITVLTVPRSLTVTTRPHELTQGIPSHRPVPLCLHTEMFLFLLWRAQSTEMTRQEGILAGP